MTGEQNRKRGRKLRDSVDDEIRRVRSKTKRAFKYIKDPAFKHTWETRYGISSPLDVEKLVSSVLLREVDLLRQREIQEIRESVSEITTEDPTAVLGSPVAVRTMLCQLSIASCVENSFRQIFHATRKSENKTHNYVSVTPECHILLSKACEQMIIEITTRACIDAENSRGTSRITSANIMRSLPVISRRWSTRSLVGNFSFAQDVMDRNRELPLHPLDQISKLHR